LQRRRIDDLVADALVLCRPVGLPRLTAIERERLLPARRNRCDVLPGKANPDGHAVDLVDLFEYAYAVHELSHDGRLQLAVADRRSPPDPPHAGLRIEQPVRRALEAGPAGKVRRIERVDVPEPAQDRTDFAEGTEFDPLVVALHQRLHA